MWYSFAWHFIKRQQVSLVFPGLCKLMEAEQSVSQLSEQLVVKEQELAVASTRADEVLQEVTAKAHAAEKVRSSVYLKLSSFCIAMLGPLFSVAFYSKVILWLLLAFLLAFSLFIFIFLSYFIPLWLYFRFSFLISLTSLSVCGSMCR